MAYFGLFSQSEISVAAKAALVAYDGFDSGLMPKGWKSVTPKTDSKLDVSGFKGEFFVNGQAAASVMRDGHTLMVSFRGTDNIRDVYDDLTLATSKSYYKKFSKLLDAVADYVKAQKITDVTFTGHSLGAAAVNMVADHAASAWGGTFKNSSFIGFESPYLAKSNSDLFNFGINNDPVYEVIQGYKKPNNLSGTYFHVSEQLSTGDTAAHLMNGVDAAISKIAVLKGDAGFDLIKDAGPESFVIFEQKTGTLDASSLSVGNEDRAILIGETAATAEKPKTMM